MRVGLDVHVLTGEHQGTVSVWENLLPALPREHTYVLYSYDPDLTARRFPGDHFEHRRIPIRQSHLRIQLAFPHIASRDRCDVLHVNYYGPLVGGPRVVNTIHDVLYLDFPEFAPGARSLQFRLLAGASARAAERVIACSDYSKRRIVHHFGLDPDRIDVIYPGLTDDWLVPDARSLDRAWSDVRHALPDRYLLTVGRLDPRKNVPLSARVARQLAGEGLSDGLVVVGPDDVGSARIEEQLRREDLEVIRLRDLTRPQLQAVYAHAQLVLFPSRAEGFGYPVAEAMALGIPLVVSNRTAVPEVAGDAALVVDPDDPLAFTEAARGILTDPDLGRRLARMGKARARQFSAAEMAARTTESYRKSLVRR